MLNRRSFLKIAGMGALALGTGYGAGSFFGRKQNTVSMYGFLPADEILTEKVFRYFANYISPDKINSVTVNGNSRFSEVIKSAFHDLQSGLGFGGNDIKINIIKLGGKNVNTFHSGDIVIRENHFILTPEENFDGNINKIRTELKSKNADYFFSAEITENKISDRLFRNNKTLIIENENGVYDEINLNRKTSDIIIKGNSGNTVITAGNGTAYVKKSSCRNKLCEHSGSLSPGNSVIACAPNKIFLRLV